MPTFPNFQMRLSHVRYHASRSCILIFPSKQQDPTTPPLLRQVRDSRLIHCQQAASVGLCLSSILEGKAHADHHHDDPTLSMDTTTGCLATTCKCRGLCRPAPAPGTCETDTPARRVPWAQPETKPHAPTGRARRCHARRQRRKTRPGERQSSLA
jgi:hypothetical protein